MSLSLIISLVVFFVLLALEFIYPWKAPSRTHCRIRTNFILLVLGYFALTDLTPLGFDFVFNFLTPPKPHFFDLFGDSYVFKVVLGVLMYDLKNYLFHHLLHKVPFLWRFHQVHHSDTSVDVWTTQRFHPLELIFGFIPIVALIMLGVPLASTIIIGFFGLPWVLFQHANIQLPQKLEQILSYIFVTPGLHKIHHSIAKEDHHYNFGVIFSFWDRFFNSFHNSHSYNYKKIHFGVQGISEIEANDLTNLLRKPFRKNTLELEVKGFE